MQRNSIKNNSLYGLIGKATDNKNESENEALSKEICSEILRSSDGPKIAAKILTKIILKALSEHKHQTIWYCLLLLDTAVKGTNSRFCAAILTKEFLNDLIKIADPKHNFQDFVIEKFEYLLLDWEKSLISVEGHQNLVKCRKNLQVKIIENGSDVRRGSRHPNCPVSNIPLQQQIYPTQQLPPVNIVNFKQKLGQDVDVMETNLTVFSDTLSNVNPETVSTEEIQFLEELFNISQQMQTRIQETISNIQFEDIINQLLQVNDKINATSDRYRRLMSSKSQMLLTQATPIGVSPPAPSSVPGPQNPPLGSQIQPSATNSHYPDLGGVYDISSINFMANQSNTHDTSAQIPMQPNNPNYVYDIGSLPTYNQAVVTNTNTKPESEMNLIDFDDTTNTKPKPNVKVTDSIETVPDLLTGDLPGTSNQTLSAEDFDSFINSITQTNQPVIHDSDEDYAPPIYDEASKSSKRPLPQLP